MKTSLLLALPLLYTCLLEPADPPRLLIDDPNNAYKMSVADLENKIVRPLLLDFKWELKNDGAKVTLSSKDKTSETPVVEIKINEPQPGKRTIELSNTDPVAFPAFKNNHAFYSRGILKIDTYDKLKKYVQEKLGLFQKSLATSKAKTIAEVSQDLTAYCESQGSFDVKLSQPKPHFSLIEVNRKDVRTYPFNKEVLHVRIFNINDETVGINVVQIDKEYQARVPKHNYDENIKDIKSVLSELLKQNKDLPITILKVENQFNTFFAAICGGKQPGLKSLVTEGVIYGADIPASMPNCPFAGSKIYIQQFNFGYLQYVYVLIDHTLLRAEYMIGLDPKIFSENLKSVLDEVSAEVQAITKLRADSKKDHKIVTEELLATLKEGMGDGFTVEQEGEAVVGKQGDTVVLKAAKAEDGSYFTISFLTPFGKKPKGASNPEFFIEEENGFNQLIRLKEYAKKFAEGIKLV